MNALVAGMAGALKDADDGEGPGVQSPVFKYRDFERLEADGDTQGAG